MELALEAWHEAGPHLHPDEFVERAMAEIMPLPFFGEHHPDVAE